MQRRRRQKAAPKNVFGAVPQSPQKSKSTKSTRSQTTRARPQIAPPPSVPGAKPTPKSEPVKTPVEVVIEPVEDPVAEPSPITVEGESVSDQIVEEAIPEEQLLDDKGSKDITPIKEEVPTSTKKIKKQSPDIGSGTSLKARQIIQDSMLKASIASKEAKIRKAVRATPAPPKEAPKKPQRKFRNRTSSYQPANRARRLDRSRHMEYKYEMRGLLVDISVSEEHRSNLLATIWARGERQTTKEAKDFLGEKLTEGIIDEKQMTSLEKVVDRYTVRR